MSADWRDYVTTAQAAEELGITPDTLRRWMKKYDEIRPAWVTPGGRFRWDLDELRRLTDPKSGLGVRNTSPADPETEPTTHHPDPT